MKNKQHDFLAQLGNLLILAELARQKKTAESSQVSQAQEDSTANQRQPKAGIVDSNLVNK